MREFGKSRKLDNVLYDVRGPVVDEAARMEESGTNVLKLNIGNPCLLYTSDVYKRQEDVCVDNSSNTCIYADVCDAYGKIKK